MKIGIVTKVFEHRIFPGETYEFIAIDCKRLTIIGTKGDKKSKVILSGKFGEVNFVGCNSELWTDNYSCQRLNILNSSVGVISGNFSNVSEMNLEESKFVFHLPLNKEHEKLVIDHVLKLTRSNFVLNDSDLKARTLILNDESRLFCEATINQIKLSLYELYEDETSYVVFPSIPCRLSVDGVTL